MRRAEGVAGYFAAKPSIIIFILVRVLLPLLFTAAVRSTTVRDVGIMASLVSFVTRSPLRPFQAKTAATFLRSSVLQSRHPTTLLARAMATKIKGKGTLWCGWDVMSG